MPVAVSVPEPNTWREILAATENRPERRIAVQEYGRTSVELIEGLRGRRRGSHHGSGVSMGSARWIWGRCAKRYAEFARGEFDVLLLTTSVQVAHLLRVASEMGLEQRRCAAR